MIVPPLPLLDPTSALEAGGTLRVETTTMLPGGTLATLSVRRTGSTYTVSDDAVGHETLLALGIDDLTSGDTRRGNEIAAGLGLSFESGRFDLDEISVEQLPSAIAYVADASRTWISGALETRSRRTERAMAERAVDRLRSMLPTLQIDTERELAGASSKLHRFDIVVTLPRDRFALFETVLPAPVSLASVHLKFYDLKHAASDWPREALVEKLAAWPSEDLAVIQQVATHVRAIDDSWLDLSQLAA